MTNLLTINGNPKVIKGDKLNTEWQSAIMHLHPSSTRICPYQDIAKCKDACLNTSGRGGIFKKGETTNVIQEARKRRTNMFLDTPDLFMEQLYTEILKLRTSANEKVNNLVSDLMVLQISNGNITNSKVSTYLILFQRYSFMTILKSLQEKLVT